MQPQKEIEEKKNKKRYWGWTPQSLGEWDATAPCRARNSCSWVTKQVGSGGGCGKTTLQGAAITEMVPLGTCSNTGPALWRPRFLKILILLVHIPVKWTVGGWDATLGVPTAMLALLCFLGVLWQDGWQASDLQKVWPQPSKGEDI